MKKIIYIIISLIAVSSLCSVADSSRRIVSVKASSDSAVILMGNRTTLHLEVIGQLDGTGYFQPNDSLWKDVEISSMGEAEIVDLGNNRKQLRKDIIIQGFDSGLYSLPPFVYIQGNETVSANPVTLKVIPVNVDTLKTINDFADVTSPGKKFFDFLPDWITDYGLWILLALIVIAVTIYIYIRYYRQGKKIPLLPKRKIIPAHVLAIDELNALQSKHLCEQGKEKEFYTELTEILRKYLSRRFGINAMEMTSGQIMRSLRENKDTMLSEPLMAQVLEIADFVKFAKVRPLPDDNVRAFSSSKQFVEDTAPKEEPVDADNKETGSVKPESTETHNETL